MEDIIRFFKKIRQRNYLNKDYSFKYAFVGFGNHSINNLYPVIHYLNLPLKYIVCKSQKTADLVSKNYSPTIGTIRYDEVLEDTEIKGVFICADPLDHFQLVRKALEKQKNVFVEKPPCTSMNELSDLIAIQAKNKQVCLTGLQKRYSNCTAILKEKLKKEKVISFNYRYVVGPYPEGDVYWDIFIHPIDYIIYLFGDVELLSKAKTAQRKGEETILLQVRRQDIIGNIEISTQYSWNQAEEKLQINTQNGVYLMKNNQSLTYQSKPGVLFSIPLEKVYPKCVEYKTLYNVNEFLPIFQNNYIVSQGYFNEINTFVKLCENRRGENLSSPEMLRDTFQKIELLIDSREERF